MKWLKDKIRAAWLQIKKWWIGLLVAIGLVAAPLVIAVPTGFTYTPATQYEDGTALPITEIAETRFYCNDVLVGTEPGASGAFTVDLSPGTYTCYATHVATNGLESAPSNSVVKTVLPNVAPNPPVLD